MSTNKTQNYNLHSWVPEDDFLRSEFNDNFTSLDTALKSLSTALTAETSAREQAVAAEAAAREQAVAAEATARQNAVNTEINARKQAVTSEAQTRASAVSTLTTSVNNLSSKKAEVVAGTYTGTGQNNQAVSLGFQPKALIVTDSTGRMRVNDSIYGGIALPGVPIISTVSEALLEITSTGFIIHLPYKNGSYGSLNSSNFTYRYIAFK